MKLMDIDSEHLGIPVSCHLLYVAFRKETIGVFFSVTMEKYCLAQLVECWSAKRKVMGSMLGWTNTQDLKITEDGVAAFAITSANG